MENTNVLKTALGVGVLGTAAVALGYYYFNDENDENDENNNNNLKFEEDTSTLKQNTTNSDITSDVIDELKVKKIANATILDTNI